VRRVQAATEHQPRYYSVFAEAGLPVICVARFWMGAADRLAGAGNETLANQATDEANFYLGRGGRL
jgi:hypothetical protein